MLVGIDTEASQGVQVELQDVRWGGLHDHLELIIVLEPVGVFAVAAVGGAAGGFHIGHVPRFGAKNPEKGGGIEGAGPLFGVIGLLDDASLLGPVSLQGEDKVLKGQRMILLLREEL